VLQRIPSKRTAFSLPTGFKAEKYRVHPIYSICRFFDDENKYRSVSPVDARAALTHGLSGCVMTDLAIQDFKDQSGEDLSQILHNEKLKMFCTQKDPAKNRVLRRLFLSSFAGPFIKLRKARGKT
jgi:hypothetical protein